MDEAKAKRIAELLNGNGLTWEPRSASPGDAPTIRPDHFLISTGDSMSPRLVFRCSRERAEVSGAWPYQPGHSVEVPHSHDRAGKTTEISMTLAKSAEQMAAEIKRRLLPDYLELFTKSADKIRQWEAHRRTSHETATIIADALGAFGRYNPERNGSSPDRPTVAVYYGIGDSLQVYGDAVCSGGKVDLNLRSVPREMAAEVLAKITEQFTEANK